MASPQQNAAMPTILTLDLKLSGWRAGEGSWSARVEVPDRFTLYDLHLVIQRLVDFDDDWMFEITCDPKTTHLPRARTRAKLIHERGSRPIQYPHEDDED